MVDNLFLYFLVQYYDPEMDKGRQIMKLTQIFNIQRHNDNDKFEAAYFYEIIETEPEKEWENFSW